MSENTIIHVGDVGTIFRLTITEDDETTAVDVSTATVKKIYFKKSDGTKVGKTAAFYTDGTDGIIQYAAIAADIDMAGIWQMQGYVEMPVGKYYSVKSRFTVHENLSA